MANTGTILSTLLFCLWWPTSKLLSVFALVLSPFWAVLQFVLLPVIYLAHAVYAVLSLPFKLNILERIEVRSFPPRLRARIIYHLKPMHTHTVLQSPMLPSNQCKQHCTTSHHVDAVHNRQFTYGLASQHSSAASLAVFCLSSSALLHRRLESTGQPTPNARARAEQYGTLEQRDVGRKRPSPNRLHVHELTKWQCSGDEGRQCNQFWRMNLSFNVRTD